MTGNSQLVALRTRTGDLGLITQKSPDVDVLSFMRREKAAAVRTFLSFFRLWILLRDQQDFPRGTLFRCCVRLVGVFQCETLAKRDRQLPGPHGFSHVR